MNSFHRSQDYPPERLEAMTVGELAELRVQVGQTVGEINLQFVERRPSVSAPKSHQIEHAEWKRKMARVLMDQNTLLSKIKGVMHRRAKEYDAATAGQRPPRSILIDLLDELAKYDLPTDDGLERLLDEAEASVVNLRMARLEEVKS